MVCKAAAWSPSSNVRELVTKRWVATDGRERITAGQSALRLSERAQPSLSEKPEKKERKWKSRRMQSFLLMFCSVIIDDAFLCKTVLQKWKNVQDKTKRRPACVILTMISIYNIQSDGLIDLSFF